MLIDDKIDSQVKYLINTIKRHNKKRDESTAKDFEQGMEALVSMLMEKAISTEGENQ